ncbi:hypothetical protein ILUMI_03105 [Ignelater luminosus]|uniref:FXNA-like protease n=1 Tax=Ignelater luminosus TaxID=2038154 RepID=A0A8K0GK90_IGNLU|nr:hypothetical protein ILUMI_03105 [Ignelater luminosus]
MRKRYEIQGAETDTLIDELDEYEYSKRRNIHSVSPTTSLFFILLLLGLFGIAILLNETLPTPLKLSDEKNYPNAFITERAQHDLKVLTSFGPRTTGSYENEALAVDFFKREVAYIQQQANVNQKIEMDIQTVSGSYFLDFKPYGTVSAYGNVQNVIIKLYSKNNSKHSLLVNSHFDSVPGSPGGGDAGFMCVLMLEILRKLSRMPERPEHNIIFLFNGAEETPLQGSHGFITQHKWAKEVDVLINLDSGGAGGKEILMQAGPGQPWLLKYYHKIPHPYAQVAAEELFQSGIIPSDTDFRIFRDFGNMIGLDFVLYKDGYRYHTTHDRFSNIELGSYQHTGDNMLSLVYNLANAPELYNPQEQSKQNFVFYDFFELFLISYSERMAVMMHIGISLISLVISIKSFCDFGLGLSLSSLKYVGLTFGAMVLSWIISGLVALGIAKIIDILKYNMTWYSHPWIILGLYIAPIVCCCCSLTMILNNFYKKSNLSISAQTQIQLHSERLLWTIILLIGTYFSIRSVYLIFILLVFHVIAAGLIQILSLQHSVKEWKIIYVFVMLLPTLNFMKLAQQTFVAFVPICGRMGSYKNPEMIIALLSLIFTILIISSFIPLLTLTRKPSVVLQVLLGIAIVSFVIIFTPLAFQYSGDPESPRPQRFWIYHTSRVFRNETNDIYKKDSGYFIFNMDRNSPHSVKNYVKGLSRMKPITEDCKRSLFCGISVLSPKVIPFLHESTLIPAEQPIIHEPISLKLNSKTSITNSITQFSFTATGPSQFTLYISAKPGAKLIRMNLVPELPSNPVIWNGRPLYVVLYTWGKEKTPLNVTLDFEIPPDWNSSIFDIALMGNFKDERTYVKTPHFAQFLREFPDWTDVIAWIGVYESWVY